MKGLSQEKNLASSLQLASCIAFARRFVMAEIMTVKELARYLKMKEVTIYRCAQEGRLPGIKIRGQWRFDKNRIDQMIDQSLSQRI